MGRYLTRRYVAVDWDEAVRLAGLDQTPIEEIRYSASVWASNSPQPVCGWSLLAQVRRILTSERLSVEVSYTTYNSPRWESLSVELCDGQRSTLYRLYVGDEDGYLCEIRTEPPE